MHNTAIHVALVVVWIFESFGLNKLDLNGSIRVVVYVVYSKFAFTERRTDLFRYLKSFTRLVAWEFYFEKLHRAWSKMII